MEDKKGIVVVLLMILVIVGALTVSNMYPKDNEYTFEEFSTLTELIRWLQDDDTNHIQYIENISDCDDLAIRMCDNAREDGYLMYTLSYCTPILNEVTIVEFDGNGTYPSNGTMREGFEYIGMNCHAYCVTQIDDIWYRIEPQTDEIQYIGTEL